MVQLIIGVAEVWSPGPGYLFDLPRIYAQNDGEYCKDERFKSEICQLENQLKEWLDKNSKLLRENSPLFTPRGAERRIDFRELYSLDEKLGTEESFFGLTDVQIEYLKNHGVEVRYLER